MGALLANRLAELAANAAASGLAGLVGVVIDAGVDRRSRVRVVHAEIEDFADAPEWTRDSDVAKTDWNITALNTGVAHVADHGVGTTNIFVTFVSITRLVSLHGGNEHEGETDENPGHPVENVDIGHNTVAKLGKRLILRCLGTDVLFNLRLLLLDLFRPWF